MEATAIVEGLRASFVAGKTRSLGWRLEQLAGIRRMTTERRADIHAALAKDLGKPDLEAFLTETAYTVASAGYVEKRLKGWMRPEKVRTELIFRPATSRIHREPYGVALIIGPWNYPFQLVMTPLIGAVAAGNCAVVKPSEVSPATSALIADMLPRYVDPSCVKVVEGGVPETTALLKERFDYIFYTGSPAVGRIVMAAAARHLTPVTLELGGKNPCIVDRDVDLEVAVRRILWGKYTNAGQTCLAPDYILAHEGIHDELLEQLKKGITECYGADPQRSPDYGRIVNGRHFTRVMKLMGSGEVVVGGQSNADQRYVAPTVLKDVAPDSPVMAEEIFGPILPVLSVPNIEHAISFANARPKALALYIFSRDKDVQRRVIEATSSGGASINHAWYHVGVQGLPFGGVGESGMGAYHGRASFETFAHRKSVLDKPTFPDLPLTYPPYTEGKKKWIQRLL